MLSVFGYSFWFRYFKIIFFFFFSYEIFRLIAFPNLNGFSYHVTLLRRFRALPNKIIVDFNLHRE